MLKKLRLGKTEIFARDIVVSKVAAMVTSMINGNPYARSIGSEQGCVPGWDDIVVETFDGSFEHLQVKQQTTNFSSFKSIRSTKRTGSEQELSPLDESMEALSHWFPEDLRPPSGEKRTFTLVLVEGNIQIKEEITVTHLARLCNEEITSLSTVEKFVDQAAKDGVTKNIVNWLKTWCGFKNEGQILNMLQCLRVQVVGNRDNVNDGTLVMLGTCFQNLDKVIGDIRLLIEEHSSMTSAITGKSAYSQLEHYSSQNTKKWTQYFLDKNNWEVSGIHDLALGSIENPATTVKSLWDGDKGGILKINARRHLSELGNAIIRLAFHLHGRSDAYFHDPGGWLEMAKNMIGGTLGADEDDFQEITFSEQSQFVRPIDFRPLEKAADHDLEANHLMTQMDAIAWTKISELVHTKIHRMAKVHCAKQLKTAGYCGKRI